MTPRSRLSILTLKLRNSKFWSINKFSILYSEQEAQLSQRDHACSMLLNISLRHSRSLKVIENGTIRKLGYGFLFAFRSNHGSILYHFRDKARYWSKIAIFLYPVHSTPQLGSSPSQDCCSTLKNATTYTSSQKKLLNKSAIYAVISLLLQSGKFWCYLSLISLLLLHDVIMTSYCCQ